MTDEHYHGRPENLTSHKTGANFALFGDTDKNRFRFPHGAAGAWHMAVLLTAIDSGKKIDVYAQPDSLAADGTRLMNTVSLA